MKLTFLLLIGACFGSFLQHGCGGTNSANQQSANKQNSFVATISPTPTVIPFSDQNAANNGVSAEEGRELGKLRERCKHAPVNNAKVTPLTGTAPLKVTFDGGSAHDPDGNKIVKWEWFFGDGQSREGRTVTYVYEKPGKYGIGLNVIDSQGQKTSDCGTGATDIEVIVVEKVNS